MENYKDANVHLVNDRKEFEAFTIERKKEVKQSANEQKETAMKEYYKKSAGSKVKHFEEMIAERAGSKCYPTGFKKLDEVLDGGLYEGLYFIGAVSSLGKTTFCLQIADQLAEQGHDVLFFTLEQSEFELMAKSLSRITFKNCKDEEDALTARSVMNGNYEYINRYNAIQGAYKEYAEMTENRLYLIQGVGDISVERFDEDQKTEQVIKEMVENHIKITGKIPVVIIDYLQILAPSDSRSSDKQNTDRAVNALKRLSRDKKIPIIGISSFNRDNYKSAVNMASFKESGAIEYSSDVLLGLQPENLGKNDSEGNEITVENCKEKDIRPVELVILKNRNGKTGGKIAFDFHSKFNCFKETDEAETARVSKQRFNPYENLKK